MLTFSLTFTDHLRGFQGHGIFEVEYLYGESYYIILIGNHT